METTYIKPPMFELNEETGTYNVTEALTPEHIFTMTKYLLASSIKDKVIANTSDVYNFLIAELGTEDREVFACLFLNTRHAVISFEKLFFGTVRGTDVYPSIVVSRALLLNTTAVICVHNHPTGNTTPSLADERITDQLRSALNMFDIKLLDHFIIGRSKIISLKMEGYTQLFN